MGGGSQHQHIASVRWTNPETGQSGSSDRAEMVKWLRNGGEAYVRDGGYLVTVRVVDSSPPYIRTYADGVWTDNLLALPRY